MLKTAVRKPAINKTHGFKVEISKAAGRKMFFFKSDFLQLDLVPANIGQVTRFKLVDRLFLVLGYSYVARRICYKIWIRTHILVQRS